MASATLETLRTRSDATWEHLTRQLHGMEPHLERSDGPGEWTTRQVLCHLLGEPGRDPAAVLATFARGPLPLVDVQAGQVVVDESRRRLGLAELIAALDDQRRRAFGYLESLPEADLLERRARIPLFAKFMGTEEVPLARFVGAMFDFHWRDHAGQLAKIRAAVGLPPA